MTTFRDVPIGATFDFVNDAPEKRMYNSFYARCTKVSARRYEWFSSVTRTTLSARVGRTSIEVFHVEEE